MTLLRSQILSSGDRKSKSVSVPEWGCTVYLRSWSLADRTEFQQMCEAAKAAEDYTDLPAKVVALSVVDDYGSRVFTPDDVPALVGKSAAILDSLVNEVLRLNGLDAGSVDAAKKKFTDDHELRLVFRLALAFGCTVAELRERMPSDEWPYWIAYGQCEPWGAPPADVRHAMLCDTLARSMGNKTSWQDFLPQWEGRKVISFADASAMWGGK